MYINIVAGGPEEHLPDLAEFNDHSIWVGVDKGVLRLISHGIEPAYAFGDFDSVTDEEWTMIRSKVKNIQTFRAEKDEPDMELAINWALEQCAEKIRIFAGTGGRLDHFLGNVQLMLRPLLNHVNAAIEIIDKKNIIFAKGPGSYRIEKDEQKKYISFIPFLSAVSGLTLTGFKYPLNDRHIPLTSTLCISNELIDDNGTFSFTKGILLVIRSND
ncbi:thiamine pyrophosphokinase [Robertmurraya siralis]|uniref:Thiamine diphosphokinase n=1 Tax=Robertmurraya siralis TaxID=77777 RepID=A0A919WGW8_9BACI|nr:thiamine diphosphokinase [Robertmurraya siralis]GIN61486.1 thiamine pyrophosphokinase [Robertmurraya siralis]